MLFFTQFFGDIFFTGDNSRDFVASFGKRRDIISKIFGVFTVTDDDGLLQAFAFLHNTVTNKTDGGTNSSKRNKTKQGGVDSNNTYGEKVSLTKKIIGNNSHSTDNGNNKEAAKARGAIFAKADGLLIKAKNSNNNNPYWDEKNDRKNKFSRFKIKKIGAVVDVGANKISKTKGKNNSKNITQD